MPRMPDSNTSNTDLNIPNCMAELVLPELSYRVVGICFIVHNELGRYRNENQYCDALQYQFAQFKIAVEREKILATSFEGERAGRNRVDFLIEESIVLEVKAKPLITREDYVQTQRYLTTLRLSLGIIVNFRQQYLHPKRVLNATMR